VKNAFAQNFTASLASVENVMAFFLMRWLRNETLSQAAIITN
jgi:hypothetical protein